MARWRIWGPEAPAAVARTLRHESAHATSYAILTGRGPASVTIALDDQYRALTRLPDVPAGRAVEEALARIVTARAGLAADARLGWANERVASEDIAASHRLADALVGRKLRHDVIRAADERARELVGDAWPAIEAVAFALSQVPYRLDAAGVERIVAERGGDAAWLWRPTIAQWAQGIELLGRALGRWRQATEAQEVTGV